MDRQAATDCGGWRAGHNGGDAAPGGGFNRAIGGAALQAGRQPSVFDIDNVDLSVTVTGRSTPTAN
jgi:hypothetical protein